MSEFENIYNKNYNIVFHYLQKLCNNHSLAEDLTQETFYNAYLYIVTNKHEITLHSSWFIKIAHNLFIDYLRKNKLTLHSYDIEKVQENTFVTYIDIKIDLENTFDKIPHKYKLIILMKDYFGFTYKEISNLLNSSVSSVKSLLSRARKKFRKEFYND
jgi:RNA polymerase sigma-70 factor (ECF subfamily)